MPPEEIEFLDASPSAISSEVEAAPGRAPRLRGRFSRRVDVVLAAALAVGLLGWLATSYSHHHDAVAVRPSPLATPSPAPLTPVEAALAQYLPKVVNTSVATTVKANPTDGGTGLIGRLIDTHVGPARVLITVSRYQHPQQAGHKGIVPTPAGMVATFIESETASYEVEIEWLAPSTSQAPADALFALAVDPRLEASA